MAYQMETSLKKKVFFAANIDKLVDPVRSTRWRMCVSDAIFKAVGMKPSSGDSFGSEEGAREFSIHISGGAKIPDAKIKNESIWYMGYQKKYPTQQDQLAGNMTLNALLLEDGRAYETMLAWNQCCLNSGILNSKGDKDTTPETDRIENNAKNKVLLGLGQQENYGNETAVLLRNSHVTLELYDWMYGDVIMGIRLINAWPAAVSVGDSLDYQTAKLMKFNFTLEYDRWNIWFNPNYKVIGPAQSK